MKKFNAVLIISIVLVMVSLNSFAHNDKNDENSNKYIYLIHYVLIGDIMLFILAGIIIYKERKRTINSI